MLTLWEWFVLFISVLSHVHVCYVDHISHQRAHDVDAYYNDMFFRGEGKGEGFLLISLFRLILSTKKRERRDKKRKEISGWDRISSSSPLTNKP